MYRGRSAGGESAVPVAAGLSEASFAERGLENGATYYYRIKAQNLKGSAASREVSVTPSVPDSFVLDGGFEADEFGPWQTKAGSAPGASYLERGGGRIVPHGGSRQYTHWASAPYDVTLFQDIALPNGPHSVSAWVKCSGGQAACEMTVSGYDGAAKSVVPIPASSDWTRISVPVTVTAGTLTLSFHSQASAGQWLNVDDVGVK